MGLGESKQSSSSESALGGGPGGGGELEPRGEGEQWVVFPAMQSEATNFPYALTFQVCPMTLETSFELQRGVVVGCELVRS